MKSFFTSLGEAFSKQAERAPWRELLQTLRAREYIPEFVPRVPFYEESPAAEIPPVEVVPVEAAPVEAAPVEAAPAEGTPLAEPPAKIPPDVLAALLAAQRAAPHLPVAPEPPLTQKLEGAS